MERRSFPRVPLDIPVFIRMRLTNGEEQKVMLIDVSCGGLQVALPAQGKGSADLLGRAVKLYDLPAPLDRLPAGKRGNVTWVSMQRCGVRFDEAVSLVEGNMMDGFSLDT